MGENVENHEIWANFDPHNFLGGAPKILKPVLGPPFQGLLPGKVWTTPPDSKGVEKISPPPIFFLGGGAPPLGVHKLDIVTPLPHVKI